MKGKMFFAVALAAVAIFTVGGCDEEKEKQYYVGDYIQMSLHELDGDGEANKTVKYLYINPLGDLRELQSDALYFVAEYPGEYTLRYLIYDRGFEVEMEDTVVTVLPKEGE